MNEDALRRMINRVYQHKNTRPYAQNLIDMKLKQCHTLTSKLKECYQELDVMRDELAFLEMGTEIEKATLYKEEKI